MVTDVQTREELHRLIDALSDEEFEDLVDLVNTHYDAGELTDDELAAIEEARAEYRRGETVPLEDVKRELGL